MIQLYACDGTFCIIYVRDAPCVHVHDPCVLFCILYVPCFLRAPYDPYDHDDASLTFLSQFGDLLRSQEFLKAA